MTRNVLLLAGITLQALTMKVQLNVAVQKISFNTAKQMGMTFVWSSCAHHNLRHQEYCQSKGYLYCSQDRPPWDHNSGCNTRDHCRSCFRSHSHIVMIAEFAIASQLLVIVGKNYHTEHLDCSRSQSRSQSRSCLCDLRSPMHNHGHYIHQDHWGRKWSHLPVAFSCLRLEHTLSPPQAQSQIPSGSRPALRPGIKAHGTRLSKQTLCFWDCCLLEIKWTPFAFYHPPLSSPDDYLGEALDASSCLESEDQQPPPSAAMTKWYDSDEDSYGSLCPEDKKYLCKRPPTIQLEEKFLHWFPNDSKHLPY